MAKNLLYDHHHRKPKKLGGTNEDRNISYVPIKKHVAFNILFNGGCATPQQIADELNKLWLDPDYILVVKRR